MNGNYRWTAPALSSGGRPAISGSRSHGGRPALRAAGVWRLFRWLLNLMLGCTHRQKSFPFTPVRKNAAPGADSSHTYVVCLDCGKTFEYDWSQMRMAPPAIARAPTDAQPIRGRVCAPPRMAAITLEPVAPRDAPQRYESTRGRVRITA
jgi:hypothetical protein